MSTKQVYFPDIFFVVIGLYIVFSAVCTLNGVTYTGGQEFLAADGCNECACTGGVITCSQTPCTPTG